jgi:hypothetical protein
MDIFRLDSLKGDVFSWENEAEYASVVGGARSAGPGRKFKIAAYGHKYFYNHTKKTAWKQPETLNLPGIFLYQLELQRSAGGVMLASAESEAMVSFPISIFRAIASFSDTRHIFAGPYGNLLSYISEIRDIPVRGGN